MSNLHTINKTSTGHNIESCSKYLKQGDAVLFIENGIYYCNDVQAMETLPENVSLYGLKEDMDARGMLEHNSAKLKTVDYNQFVELCCKYDKVISWF